MAPAPKLTPERLKQPLSEVDLTEKQISPTETRDERIAKLAYQFWEDRGSPHGSSEDDWFRAEQEVVAEDAQIAEGDITHAG